MKRLFIAINFHDNLKEKIFSHYSSKLPKKELKIVQKQNQHITLKFLGNMGEKNEQHIKAQMQKISAKKFEVQLGEMGEFGGRVIWVGITDPEKNIENISEQLDLLLGLNDPKFHPHSTIARNKELGKMQIKKMIGELNAKKIQEKFIVQSIDLMESSMQSSGPVYSKVFEKKLE